MNEHSPANSITHVVVGLDVHKDSVAVCVYDATIKRVLLECTLKNQPTAIRKMITDVRGRFGEPHCCYEASSCGFVLFRLLRELHVACDVVAPSSIPRRSGDRIKTDRIDAHKLATMYAAGLLTAVDVPDEELEATRALVRCRAALVEECGRAKKRIAQLLLTRGYAYRAGANWTQKYWEWLARIRLGATDQIVLDAYVDLVHYLEAQINSLETSIEEEAAKPRYHESVATLKAFRGIATVTALSLSCELGDIRRFAHPRQLMAYLGLVPTEHSSGNSVMRGSITKSGNSHARKAIVSAAWKYTLRPTRSYHLKQRQRAVSAHIVAISWKAQQRLYKRFHALAFRKPRSVAATAVARELAGFLWEALQSTMPQPHLAPTA